MKSTQRMIVRILVAALVLFIAPAVFAQMGQGMGKGMGQGMGMHMPKYDTATVVTVKGTIEEVQQTMMPSGQKGGMTQSGQMGMHHMGLHLVLKTDKESLTVLVGPAQFVKDKDFTFTKGDEIEVTGSKVKYNNADAIIAREIKKGDKTLTLRNDQGIPEWSKGNRS